MDKSVQAKHVDDGAILSVVYRLSTGVLKNDLDRRGLSSGAKGPDAWTFTSDIMEYLPSYPPKVVVAKLAAMVRRGLMHGCACGCRGDFFVTEKGRSLIGVTP